MRTRDNEKLALPVVRQASLFRLSQREYNNTNLKLQCVRHTQHDSCTMLRINGRKGGYKQRVAGAIAHFSLP